MKTSSRVISMKPTPSGGFVRIQLEDGHRMSLSLVEVRCCDIRVGDTLSYSHHTNSCAVRLALRPPEAVPYQA